VFDFGAPLFATDEQTLVVTVTNNPDKPAMISKPVTMPVVATVPTGVLT
jgi:hypothetical protein